MAIAASVQALVSVMAGQAGAKAGGAGNAGAASGDGSAGAEAMAGFLASLGAAGAGQSAVQGQIQSQVQGQVQGAADGLSQSRCTGAGEGLQGNVLAGLTGSNTAGSASLTQGASPDGAARSPDLLASDATARSAVLANLLSPRTRGWAVPAPSAAPTAAATSTGPAGPAAEPATGVAPGATSQPQTAAVAPTGAMTGTPVVRFPVSLLGIATAAPAPTPAADAQASLQPAEGSLSQPASAAAQDTQPPASPSLVPQGAAPVAAASGDGALRTLRAWSSNGRAAAVAPAGTPGAATNTGSATNATTGAAWEGAVSQGASGDLSPLASGATGETAAPPQTLAQSAAQPSTHAASSAHTTATSSGAREAQLAASGTATSDPTGLAGAQDSGATPQTSDPGAAPQARTDQAARLPAHHLPVFAASVMKRFESGLRTMQLRLDPPELGKVEVKLTVMPDRAVEAVVSTDRPETLAELQRAARDLAAALVDAGLELAEGALSFELDLGAGDPGTAHGGNPQNDPGSARERARTAIQEAGTPAAPGAPAAATTDTPVRRSAAHDIWQRARVALTA
jgi:flagellar hook-length control protein FliK